MLLTEASLPGGVCGMCLRPHWKNLWEEEEAALENLIFVDLIGLLLRFVFAVWFSVVDFWVFFFLKNYHIAKLFAAMPKNTNDAAVVIKCSLKIKIGHWGEKIH